MTASSSPGRTTPLTSLSIGLLSTETVTPLNTSSRGRCWSRHGKWIVVLGTLDSTLQQQETSPQMLACTGQNAYIYFVKAVLYTFISNRTVPEKMSLLKYTDPINADVKVIRGKI
jgi:hypothetical protein